MITLTLYSTSNCSLCDSLKADLLAIQPEVGFVLLEQIIGDVADDERSDYIHEDEEKLRRYKNLVPVLDIEYGRVLYSPFSYDELFDAIDAAVKAHAE